MLFEEKNKEGKILTFFFLIKIFRLILKGRGEKSISYLESITRDYFFDRHFIDYVQKQMNNSASKKKIIFFCSYIKFTKKKTDMFF